MNRRKANDSQIVKAVLDGNIELFEELVLRYERLLFSFLLTRLPNLHEVEDLVQETFVRAFRHLAGFDRNRKLSAWLVTIARNLLIDYRRASSRSITSTEIVNAALGSKSVSNDRDQPSDIFIRREAFREVCAMIAEFPKEVRTPFVLRIVNELSYQEIADTLDLPLQTVKNRIFKARNFLRNKKNDG